MWSDTSCAFDPHSTLSRSPNLPPVIILLLFSFFSILYPPLPWFISCFHHASFLPSLSMQPSHFHLFIHPHPSRCFSLHPPFSVTSHSSFPLNHFNSLRGQFSSQWGPLLSENHREQTLGLFRSLKLFSGNHLSACQTVNLMQHKHNHTFAEALCTCTHLCCLYVFAQETQEVQFTQTGDL